MADISKKTLDDPISTKVDNDEKYPIEDFKINCEALGYSKEVVAGALFDCKENEITKTEFKKRVTNFLERKVK